MTIQWLANLEGVIQKDEAWVVTEIRKGWAAVQHAEQSAEIDVLNIFHWISTNQQTIISGMQKVLTDIQAGATIAAGVIGPQQPIAAIVATATTAINAGTAAINILAQGIQQGATPMSTVANAFTATKSAANAANEVIKAAAQPAQASAQ